MKTLILNRLHQNQNQTSGTGVLLGEDNFPLFTALSLERGWRNNERGISCYPKGEYEVVFEYSDRFKRMLWEVKGVANRSECKFHSANHWYQLEGCTSFGLDYTDMNGDGYKDITASVSTMNRFHKALQGETKFKLIVTGGQNIF